MQSHLYFTLLTSRPGPGHYVPLPPTDGIQNIKRNYLPLYPPQWLGRPRSITHRPCLVTICGLHTGPLVTICNNLYQSRWKPGLMWPSSCQQSLNMDPVRLLDQQHLPPTKSWGTFYWAPRSIMISV